MTRQIAVAVVAILALARVSVLAQPLGTAPLRIADFLDEADGLSLADAMTRALEQEPTLRAARHDVLISRASIRQAELRPNPSISPRMPK